MNTSLVVWIMYLIFLLLSVVGWLWAKSVLAKLEPQVLDDELNNTRRKLATELTQALQTHKDRIDINDINGRLEAANSRAYRYDRFDRGRRLAREFIFWSGLGFSLLSVAILLSLR